MVAVVLSAPGYRQDKQRESLARPTDVIEVKYLACGYFCIKISKSRSSCELRILSFALMTVFQYVSTLQG